MSTVSRAIPRQVMIQWILRTIPENKRRVNSHDKSVMFFFADTWMVCSSVSEETYSVSADEKVIAVLQDSIRTFVLSDAEHYSKSEEDKNNDKSNDKPTDEPAVESPNER